MDILTIEMTFLLCNHLNKRNHLNKMIINENYKLSKKIVIIESKKEFLNKGK